MPSWEKALHTAVYLNMILVKAELYFFCWAYGSICWIIEFIGYYLNLENNVFIWPANKSKLLKEELVLWSNFSFWGGFKKQVIVYDKCIDSLTSLFSKGAYASLTTAFKGEHFRLWILRIWLWNPNILSMWQSNSIILWPPLHFMYRLCSTNHKYMRTNN